MKKCIDKVKASGKCAHHVEGKPCDSCEEITAGQLIDRLLNGGTLKKVDDGDDFRTLTLHCEQTPRGKYFYMKGWGSASGTIENRLRDIIEHPELWSTEGYHRVAKTERKIKIMDVFPKYIVEDGALILSKVTYHHQLVTDKTKVKGGGWFRRDEKGDFIFHGNSHDFGMASLEDVRECIMNDQVFTNKFSDHSIATKHRFYYDTQTEILLITTLLNK